MTSSIVIPPDFHGMLLGVGGLFILIIFGIILSKFIKPASAWARKSEKFSLYEEAMLDRVAGKRGIDLEKEVIKRELLDKKKKEFRDLIREEIYDEMFPEKTK